MANSKILIEIKRTLPDIVDSNGNFRTVPIGNVGKRRLSGERLDLLKSFVDLLQNTTILCRETKTYLFDPHITLKEVTDKLNEEGEKQGKNYNYNTVVSKVGYDRGKLDSVLGKSFFSDIIYKTKNKKDLDNYRKLLGLAFIRYGKTGGDKVRENLLLPLNKSHVYKDISDEKFDEFIRVIMPYIKSQVKAVAESIDPESVGYFNYIISSPILPDEDMQRLYRLKLLMGLVDEQVVTEIATDGGEEKADTDGSSSETEDNTEDNKEVAGDSESLAESTSNVDSIDGGMQASIQEEVEDSSTNKADKEPEKINDENGDNQLDDAFDASFAE